MSSRRASTSRTSTTTAPGGGRAGAPYDIQAIDVLNASLKELDDSVDFRCPNGPGPSCLVIVKNFNDGYDDSDPSACTVTKIVNRPPAQNDMLQRGTKVTFTLVCPTKTADDGDDEDTKDDDEDEAGNPP